MKTSDSDLKVNRTIYPDAVTCDTALIFANIRYLLHCSWNADVTLMKNGFDFSSHL